MGCEEAAGAAVNGREYASVLMVADYLLDGFEASVQGGEKFVERVYSISYDDGPFVPHYVERTKQPGIRLMFGDETIFVATSTREGAEALLDRALVELELATA
jgi:hypothetical protein